MMKIARFLVLFTVFIGSLVMAGTVSAVGSPGDGQWVSLFNGRDLSGWVPMNDPAFTVTDGVIHLGNGSGWLRTEKQYSDFVLEVEWRALQPKYNSGVFVRAALEGKPFPPEVWQVNLKESAVGELLKGSTNRVPGVTPPQPLNQWVKFRIEARGKKITLDVDGKRAWEFNELEPDRGYIGLQSEGRPFDFRNLRIQDLGTSSPPAPK